MGSWKISEMRAPRTARIVAFGQGQQILAVEDDSAAGHLSRRLQQSQNGKGGDRLAAAGFTDQPQRFARCDREADVVRRPGRRLSGRM